ncbi:glycosyltransferase family 2 protein [Bifidobacterium olomucense]|uniref:Family 2 glycosyl transferase n=1 Tax=Bifidobacterium olomucense TaxID=2675324 RepID=A0A7Y0EWF4_9BIFI|nr:glycosyltransferase [Bifidobacterium sp. DSM 109959]NMM97685.1 family 2 glycosyl transferase [Bifidobacterium sp. DSM 109959]
MEHVTPSVESLNSTQHAPSSVPRDLVSVIVPVYNVERYLPACLDALIGQTYQTLEIMLIDDGSTDGSAAICDVYAARDERVHVIHQTNRGQSAARNAGLDRAQGEYICFVDADDIPNRKYVETLVRGMEDHDADMATIRFSHIDQNGRPIERHAPHNRYDTIVTLNREQALVLILTNRLESFPWSYAAKSTLYNGPYHVRFPEGQVMEDAATTYRAMANGSRLVYLPVSVYQYRIRAGSTMDGNNPAITQGSILNCTRILKTVDDLGLPENDAMDIRCRYFEILIACHYTLLRDRSSYRHNDDSATQARYVNSLAQSFATHIDVSRLPLGTRLRWQLMRWKLSPIVAFIEHMTRRQAGIMA